MLPFHPAADIAAASCAARTSLALILHGGRKHLRSEMPAINIKIWSDSVSWSSDVCLLTCIHCLNPLVLLQSTFCHRSGQLEKLRMVLLARSCAHTIPQCCSGPFSLNQCLCQPPLPAISRLRLRFIMADLLIVSRKTLRSCPTCSGRP